MKEKIALLTLTDRGLDTILRIVHGLPESVQPKIYLHQKVIPQKNITAQRDYQVFSRLKDIVPQLWQESEVLVFVMASGIVVRQIASLVEGKDRDPAVLVLDEAGEFVIPLLSGHLGGANAWARQISEHIKAVPVITTATDVRGMVAPDEYARRYGWKVEPVSHLPEVNSLLLKRSYLNVWTSYPFQANENAWLQDSHYRFLPDSDKDQANVIIDAFPDSNVKGDSLYLVPPVLSVGVGCRRGVAKEIILERILTAIQLLGASPKAISGLYSIDLKSDEVGLIEAAAYLGVPFRTFPAEELQTVNHQNQLNRSNFVSEKIGVDGVCEAASLLGTSKGRLILPKTKGQGVTVAISIENFML
ncbi:cobalamin biosynthesis protein CbiG [Desulfosporosinus orientis DSM 765]|uniref:Cobalamin biosynthesis protein CbiG n=1 Tax=Desulfosporosinus orientis (strain ATCC 19365 / DSM 765 / NCIMB 8382 / VKM B-1628 / Singapore I) TaxID=768706 RepID=G7WDK1_DESOD|nr:cobalt-precorrin 5A hydrolase [Desulfosporosinus orientis]AET68326.1 cobalamin biosynthesis protein CbiG [Desulfosporosinus orientis DSM 765]